MTVSVYRTQRIYPALDFLALIEFRVIVALITRGTLDILKYPDFGVQTIGINTPSMAL